MEQGDWSTLTPSEKKRQLYIRQKKMLGLFLERNAISLEQYEESLGDLSEKMGMEDIADEKRSE